MCPTIQQLLEAERDSWFGPAGAGTPTWTKGSRRREDWGKYSDRLYHLLNDYERYLLLDPLEEEA
jgi:hypothetical protein